MKKIFKKIVSKSDIRPEITKVLFTKKKLVCTDSYTLLEVNRECFKKDDERKLSILESRFTDQALFKPEELDLDDKILASMPIEENTTFPDYQKVIPTHQELSIDYHKVCLDPQKLATVSQAINDTFGSKKYSKVVLYIPKNPQKPVVLQREDQNATGLIMPLSQ